MRILLCGEGPHDVGNRDVWDPRTHTSTSVEGWLQVLVRLLREGDEVEFEYRLRDEIKTVGKNPFRPSLDGHGEKARLARWIAENEEFDAIIYMADCDDDRRNRFDTIVSQIEAGFDDIQDRVTIPALACVPMSASESWVLADEAAWTALGLAAPAMLPRQPEQIWGERHDPVGNHPKHYFARVAAAAGLSNSRETRVRVMEASDVGALARKLPVSFKPFHDAVRAIPSPAPDAAAV